MLRLRNIKDEKKKKSNNNITGAFAYFFKLEYSQISKPNDFKKDYANYLGKSVWAGGLAELLGLSDLNVKPEHFISLSNSLHPITYEKIAKKNKGKADYDFMDLTFSTPKDFSQLAFLDTEIGYEKYDEALIRAHKKTMDYIAKSCVSRLNSNNDLVSCPNFLYAGFKHETSRPTTNRDDNVLVRPDPQLHIHTILSKYVADEDGKVRTIKRKFLFQNQVLFGTYFRAQLANELRNFGFEVIPHDEILIENKNGKDIRKKIKSFKVVGISNEQRLMFSKRKKDIEYLAKKYGVDSTKSKDLIARNFRNGKAVYDRDELINIWKEDALLVNLSNESIQEIKNFSLHEMHKHIKTDEDIIRSSANVWNGKKYLTERNIKLALVEYSQFVQCNIEDKFQEFIFKGLIKKVGKFNYMITFDEEIKSKRECIFYERKNHPDYEKFVYLQLKKECVNFKLPENNYLLNLEDKVCKPTITKEMIENFKAQEVKLSSNPISNFGKTLENLYQNLDDLEQQLRNPKLSIDEIAKIKAQIIRIQLEIEEIEKRKKNVPQ